MAEKPTTRGSRGAEPRTEHRWPVFAVTMGAFLLFLLQPDPLPWLPSWVIPALGLLVIAPLIWVNPTRLTRETAWSRWIGAGFALGLALVNQVYVVQIVMDLVDGAADGPDVLLEAGAVWLTNVVAFALVCWELDKGGPVARRVEGIRDDARQDFRFPQQDGSPGTDPRWEPVYFDYLFFSLSTMMAFSPTDVLPLTLRAKALLAYEALTGFVLLALVISRAVNILT
jgi:hypothetical protein